MVGIFGLLILAGYIFLACKSVKYQGDFFYRMGCYLYDRLRKQGLCLQGDLQVKKDLEGLFSVQNDEKQCESYYAQKYKLMLSVLLIGTVLALLLWGKNCAEDKELQSIVRKEAGEGAQEIQVEAVIDKEKTILWLEVEERLLGKAEVEERLKACLEELEELFASWKSGDTSTVSELPDMLEGYPFEILWRRTGERRVTGYFYYGEDVYVHEFSVEKGMTEADLSTGDRLLQAVELENLYTAEEEALRLPQTLDGKSIRWKEVKEDYSGILLLLTVFVTVSIWFLKDRDLHDEWLKRKTAMRMSYPMVLNKFVLFMGAGLTVRGSFIRIAQEWQKKGGHADEEIYREMLYACNELNAGVSESLVYERFGKRTGLEEYTRFATMLNQNLKKGNATLLSRLREESEKAQKETIHIRKKMGEEAQTKLLIPMIMMMAIVMLLVMLPAFSSF